MDEIIESAVPLKDCPFCGRPAEMIRRPHSSDGPGHLVRCDGLPLEPCVEGREFGWPEGDADAQMAAAAKWWNTRA